MPLYAPDNSPEKNLEILASNEYPGRMLVQGFAGNVAVQAYVLGGRSDDSRNRVLKQEDNIVYTEIFDKSKPAEHPELTIYDAERRTGTIHIISNGNQTNTAIEYLRSGRTFKEAMESREYEGDSNHTPRISGFIDIDPDESHPKFGLSIIRKVAVSYLATRDFYTDKELELKDSVGYALQTYLGNGDPLPSYEERPFTLPLLENAQAMTELLWDNLSDTKVAVATKTIAPSGEVDIAIKNIHEQ